MTDERLIYRYLNREYTVVFGLTKNIYNSNDDGIEIGNLKGEGCRPISEVKAELGVIFKGFKSTLIEKVFNDWLNENIRMVVNNFNQFLNQCDLRLGISEWEIIHKQYGKINQKLLKNYYHGQEKPYLVTLQHLMDEWFDQKVIEASEKQMRNMW